MKEAGRCRTRFFTSRREAGFFKIICSSHIHPWSHILAYVDIWYGSQLVIFFTIMEASLLRVIITDLFLFVRHVWSSRKFPQTNVRSIRIINAEIVVETSRVSLIRISVTIKH